MLRPLLLLISWTLLVVPCAAAQQPTLSPSYWKQRLFFIPYQIKSSGKLIDPIAKVQLLYSRTGANDWETLQEAEPNVQGFSYHAPEDGEYWFALQHLDRRGQPWPNADVQPQMRIVVDTTKPQLQLAGSATVNGEIVIRYEARDVNLQPESLLIEVRKAGNIWSPLLPSTPDLAHPDRLMGRVQWQPPQGEERVELRASISDKAGQRGLAATEVNLHLPQLSMPKSQTPGTGPILNRPIQQSSINSQQNTSKFQPSQTVGQKQSNVVTNPFTSPALLPAQDWPASNRLATNPRVVPPVSNPYATANQTAQNQAVNRMIGTGQNRTNDATASDNQMQSLSITPLGPDNSSSQMEITPWPTKEEQKSDPENAWSNVGAAEAKATLVVNSRVFDVEYDLQAIGPWGVSKVELWGTQDGGRTWQSYGVDPDNRSPIRVNVPSTGTYGFRILVDGANTAGAATPQKGDEPELIVTVDLQPPSAELLSADLGQGNLADHLLIRWSAEDSNLESRPIALYYSSFPNGPWSTIASGLENTGSYTWRIERHVPGRFYIRLEARDTAGNLATFQTPTPIALSRPQPMGKLRNVRPITARPVGQN